MIDNFAIMQVKPKRIIGVQFEAVRRNIKIAETTEDGMIYLPCFFVGVVPSSPSVGPFFFIYFMHIQVLKRRKDLYFT
jgi:hypothetical protein